MNAPLPDSDPIEAVAVTVTGRVQGVGYRPFVYRLAREHGVAGWVRNETGTAVIRAEGARAALAAFVRGLTERAPPLARPVLASAGAVPPQAFREFVIRDSEASAAADIHLPPDLYCCPDCAAELADPAERRFGYAFTNCTQCGPRYTIIAALPYDRASTAMAEFPLCPDCAREYQNPADRRFHAEPLACPVCGPQLRFHRDAARSEGAAALDAAIAALRGGAILAVKGVGGYHLLCDAASDAAVNTLRARKRRPEKPLAAMFPWRGADGLDAIRAQTAPTALQAAALCDPVRPIVLVRRHSASTLSAALAPGLTELGVFLAYSPLHMLLLDRFAAPLVATSGNLSGEPVITDPVEAEARLTAAADGFLHHNRPILRPADDPVLRENAGAMRPVRLGRGVAPLEVDLPRALRMPVLAVGGHMKCAIGLGFGARAVIGPHIGDLDSPRSLTVFETAARDLPRLYQISPARLVCDAHPGYASARWAAAQGLPLMTVQHHRAHASALAVEHPQLKSWLMLTWDGVGLGDDGTLWGGEVFAGRPGGWRRAGSLVPLTLLGGDKAGREPWRAAAAACWQNAITYDAPGDSAGLARAAWQRGIRTSQSSAAGRLFDAAAALVLGITYASYEGQGPMQLEAIGADEGDVIDLPLIHDGDVLRLDWAPLIPHLMDARRAPAERSALFHDSLAAGAVAQIAALAKDFRCDAVGLTGGVFQNRRLAEAITARLAARGMRCHLPLMTPPNDGGLALGQIAECLAREGAIDD